MKTNYYVPCTECDGDGYTMKYCCNGIDTDGNISCGCYGRGDAVDCKNCDGKGEVLEEEVEWDFDTLDDAETHDYQTYYSISGKGCNSGKDYVATAIYTCGELDEITDIQLQ